jgi:hypothetical protein
MKCLYYLRSMHSTLSYALVDVVDATYEPRQLMDAILTYWHTACAATHWMMWLMLS